MTSAADFLATEGNKYLLVNIIVKIIEPEFHSRPVVLFNMCFIYTLKVFHSLYSFFFPKSVSTIEFEIERAKSFLMVTFFPL